MSAEKIGRYKTAIPEIIGRKEMIHVALRNQVKSEKHVIQAGDEAKGQE